MSLPDPFSSNFGLRPITPAYPHPSQVPYAERCFRCGSCCQQIGCRYAGFKDLEEFRLPQEGPCRYLQPFLTLLDYPHLTLYSCGIRDEILAHPSHQGDRRPLFRGACSNLWPGSTAVLYRVMIARRLMDLGLAAEIVGP